MDSDVLEKALSGYSHLEWGTYEDDQSLMELVNSVGIPAAGYTLFMDRSPSFFNFYKANGIDHHLLTCRNDDGSLVGVAGALFREGMTPSGPGRIAYMCDLKMGAGAAREAQKQWRDFYPKYIRLLRDPSSPYYCKDVMTAVFKDNVRALELLTKRLKGLSYHQMGSYLAVTTLGEIPFRARKSFAWDLISDSKEREQIEVWINENRPQKLWAPLGDQSERWQRDVYSPQLPFVVIKNSQGEIRAVARVSNPEKVRKLVPRKISTALRILGKVLPLVGKMPLAEGKALRGLDIVEMIFDREVKDEDENELALNLVSVIQKKMIRSMKGHFINWLAPNEKIRELARGSFVNVYTEGILFRVALEEDPKSEETESPYFEVCL
jgi:hypothetical protein